MCFCCSHPMDNAVCFRILGICEILLAQYTLLDSPRTSKWFKMTCWKKEKAKVLFNCNLTRLDAKLGNICNHGCCVKRWCCGASFCWLWWSLKWTRVTPLLQECTLKTLWTLNEHGLHPSVILMIPTIKEAISHHPRLGLWLRGGSWHHQLTNSLFLLRDKTPRCSPMNLFLSSRADQENT